MIIISDNQILEYIFSFSFWLELGICDSNLREAMN